MNSLPTPLRANRITAQPLFAIIFGLALAAAPLFSKVAPLAIAIFLAACGFRIFAWRRHGKLPSTLVKTLLFGMGVGAVAFNYGSVLGIEPGLSILVLLVSLKLLETNNVRDFQVVTLLGYFLALCDLFFSQDFILWLYVAVAFTILTAALIRFHGGARGIRFGRSGWMATKMLLQGLPLTVILFLFFPRNSGGFRFQFSQSLLSTEGMSNSLSPGSISGIALHNDEVAFRAEFPDGQKPAISTMYWRSVVLWAGDGLNWSVGHSPLPDPRQRQLAGPAIRQRISLQPHGDYWLFALDRPASNVRDAFYIAGDCLQSRRQITSTLLYEVTSQPDNREKSLLRDERNVSLRKPTHLSEGVSKLAGAWRKAATSDRDLVNIALKYFRDQRFVYSMQPGAYPAEGALDEFLFNRRKGFCEHYAAAFATLMRVAEIPSRVVIGYHGGEFNEIGKYVIVRQSDAHAWCEVWIRDNGWIRVDPTDMIAPDLRDAAMASFLEGHAADAAAAARTSAAMLGWKDLLRQTLLAWDNVNYQWDLWVLNFDEDNQRSFLSLIGLRAAKWSQILTGAAGAIALLLGLFSLFLRLPGRVRTDQIGRCYARFCRVLENAGVPREAAEGANDFGQRAAARFPAQATAIREITSLYIQSRYARNPPPAGELIRAIRALPRLEKGDTK